MHFPPNCLLNHLNLRCMQTCSIEELAWMTYKTNKQGKNFNRNSFQKRKFFKKTGILVFNVTNLHYPHTPKNPKECPLLANYKQKLVNQIVAWLFSSMLSWLGTFTNSFKVINSSCKLQKLNKPGSMRLL